MEKKRFVSLSVIGIVAITAAVISSSHGLMNPKTSSLGASSYQMSFSSSSRLTDHNNHMYTNNNNSIAFSYTGSLSFYSDGWQTLSGSVFNTDPINWWHSDIRGYLNNTFYKRAFSINPSPVKLEEVDNSTTANGLPDADEYLCQPYLVTLDYVYLPSYGELTNSDYGFTNDASRKRTVTSDYATTVGGYFPANYLTRSPTGQGKGYMYGDNNIRTVNSSGGFDYGTYPTRIMAIAPEITITI